MTFKDEITTLIENNVFWSDDDTCDISQDLPEKIIKIITKKLDKETEEWKKHDHVLGHFAAYVLQELKKELEK